MAHPVTPDANAVGVSDATLDIIRTSFDTAYTWNYGDTRQTLQDLYEKAKRDQWNATTQIDWEIPVDPESEIIPVGLSPLAGYAPYDRLMGRERARFSHAELSFNLSQILHGEQGAMIIASQLVSAVPGIDAKYYAATQTMDEARHVEVFSRYLRSKLEGEWPVNAELKELLDTTIRDSRWDFKYLGMQIVIEGLAMAAFGSLYQVCQDPLLKSLLLNVMRDESRHVAFGVLSLEGYYDDMLETERREREDFLIYACEMSRNRMVGEEIADVMGWNRSALRAAALNSPTGRAVRGTLFARIVPNLKRLGLLTPRVRRAFTDLDIIEFEHMDPEFQEKQFGLA